MGGCMWPWLITWRVCVNTGSRMPASGFNSPDKRLTLSSLFIRCCFVLRMEETTQPFFNAVPGRTAELQG
jgi:hypothetical protein